MESPYVYKSLNKELEEIRLLRIDKVKPGKQIRCTLRHVSMKTEPKYVALSYAWDNPFGKADQVEEHGEGIIINKKPSHTAKKLPIRYNLACALRTLPHGSSHWYWIDAICLNQSDVAERNEQVLRMGFIYSKAFKVIAWLGPANDNSNLAFDLMRDISDRTTTSDKLEVQRWVESTLNDEACHDSWLAFIHLSQRAWWRRTWAVQEMVHARDLEIWCGMAQLDLMTFYTACSTFFSTQVVDFFENFSAAGSLDQSSDALGAIASRLAIRATKDLGDTMPLLSILYMTQSHLATDPRDKLFAILSLVYKDERNLITVDYNISTRNLYISFAQKYIEAIGDLQIITLAHENDPADFPSWVPNWTQTQGTMPLSPALLTGDDCNLDYRAHKGKRSRCRFSDDLNRLTSQGVCFDSVDGLGGYAYTGVDLENREAVQSSAVKSAYGSAETTFEAIWRSLCGNTAYIQGRCQLAGDFGAHFAKLLLGISANEKLDAIIARQDAKALASAFDQFSFLCLGGRTIREIVLEASKSPETPESRNVKQERWANVLPDVRGLMGERRFVITQQGYVGLAPRSTRKGDKIFVLLGCRTPVILRPEGDSFRLVGECYIHGVMNGEVIDELEAGKYQLRDVTIV